MRRLRRAAMLVIATATLGVVAMTTADVAVAAPTDPASAITSDPNAANGTVAFYNAAGSRVVSGTSLNHLFDFALASSAGRSGATKATLFLSFPDHTQADSQNWPETQQSGSTNFPNTGATTPAELKNNPNPLVTLGASDANYTAASTGASLDTDSGYAGIVQVRVYDSGIGVPKQVPFWASDIYVDTIAGTWTQVFPALTATSISTPVANPASPAPASTTSVALSATVSASDGSHPTGSVELFDGSTDLGAATFNVASGAVSATASVASGATSRFKFVFTPAGSGYLPSSSSVVGWSRPAGEPLSSVVLTGPASAMAGDSLTYVAAVSVGTTALSTADGKVQFSVSTDEGMTFNNVGSLVPLDSAGRAAFSYATASGGTVQMKGTFRPTDLTAYSGSTSNTVTTTIYAGDPPDPQALTVTVPQGTLVISTPYTPANPFKLGTMQLNAAGTQFTASANFGDPNAPTLTDPGNGPSAATNNGVTITDTRAGSTGWTASAQTTDFTATGLATVIDGNNLTFTNVTPKYLTGNHLQAGSVVTADIDDFKTVKRAFATTTTGPGTVAITGVMGLTAPTSTLPGTYTATVTFTIA